MSNIYVTEPPYSGKVVLETNKGDIEVELFAKECPQTCKNFIALSLEGYYDNIIWHRIVPDFIIQTGDPTGSGVGGESFYGQSFSDELHQRLRFNRRGLLGMANASQPNSNDSQFFFTLGNTPELQGRHTMFGRISNNTIYNLVSLAESAGEIGEDDRPLFPPKLRTIRVVENPFEGEIELRITREEREQMKRNKREAAKRKLERDTAGTSEKKKKNISLLSFGEEEDVKEGEALKGPKSSHDLLKNDKRLRAEAAVRIHPAVTLATPTSGEADGERPEKKKRKDKSEIAVEPLSELREQHASKTKQSSSAEKIAELEASLRGDGKRQSREEDAKRKKSGRGKDMLQEYRNKYRNTASISSSKKKDEETASLLSSFQKRLRAEAEAGKKAKQEKINEEYEEVPADLREYGGSDGEDDDADWRSHKFDFGGKAVANDGHDNDEYVTLDPRDTTSSKAALLGFGGSEGSRRAKEEKARDGRRGRDWVDQREYRDRDRRQNEKGGSRGTQSEYRSRKDDDLGPRDNLDRW